MKIDRRRPISRSDLALTIGSSFILFALAAGVEGTVGAIFILIWFCLLALAAFLWGRDSRDGLDSMSRRARQP